MIETANSSKKGNKLFALLILIAAALLILHLCMQTAELNPTCSKSNKN